MNQNIRLSRKSKKSILQIPPTTQHQQRFVSKDFCKSINIFPIKIQTGNQISQVNLEYNLNTNSSIKNFNNTITSILQKQNMNYSKIRLSHKHKPSLKIQNQDQIKFLNELYQNHTNDEILTEQQISKITLNKINNHRTSINLIHNNNTILPIDQDCQRLFQKLHKNKQLLMFDQSRLIIQAKKFKNILNDFNYKIRQIKTDRDYLQNKVQKFEMYFKELRFKHIPQADFVQSDIQKNQQLKILNLQKKIQTLNYIVKQYRTNNNQQIKVFQEKLKNYKPNIEKQLTQKLAETNQKYQKITKKVQFYENNIIGKQHQQSWQNLINKFMQKSQQNQSNIGIINQLKKNVQQLQKSLQTKQNNLQKLSLLEQNILSYKQKNQILTDKKLQLEQLIEERQLKIDQLSRLNQQTTFKLQGLKNLELRIQSRDKTIKKNTILINRLQSQNIELKTKVNSVLSDFQSRVFCEKNLQDTLSQANTNINELTNRIHQTFMDMCETSQFSKNQRISIKQKQHFVGHLFQKIKNSYNQIINEYQNQLKLTSNECQRWKDTFNLIVLNQQQKYRFIQSIENEFQKIQQKKFRCQESFTKITGVQTDFKQNDCIKCTYIATYWGQLQNSYMQIKTLMEKVVKIQSEKTLPIEGQRKLLVKNL